MALCLRLSDSPHNIGSSDPDTMERTLDLESDKPVPGMWRFPTHRDLCCIYRVPNSMRRENPEAYTPQMVLIGPLHHSLKYQAHKSRGDITKANSMAYLNMEEHKKIYLAEFAKRVEGKKTIDGFRKIIEEDETIIRATYSESTAWIESPEFVEMILHDSVFIIEFIMRTSVMPTTRIGDPLVDEIFLARTVRRDLMLLENQLPYFVLNKLFDPVLKILNPNKTFRQLVIKCLPLETLPYHCFGEFKGRQHMYSAEKLHSGGVKFKAAGRYPFSLYVKFVDGCLKIPTLIVDEDAEITLRNIMAFEQCHCRDNPHVCNYVLFFKFLIDTEKDVEFLVQKDIIKNRIGNHGSVATMVNKLCLGVIDFGSYHSMIESDVNAHYKSRYKKALVILKRVYTTIFGELPTP
ncbi:unnamed protein product [Arabis nemorensis]|uniref:Uncharacterized protein n=1 Tax=Arabis nemorensis TaxID=586526 RepID=A0A565BYG4_9BRAS|nr:unnamed protein product [Arabis nemorensis]